MSMQLLVSGPDPDNLLAQLVVGHTPFPIMLFQLWRGVIPLMATAVSDLHQTRCCDWGHVARADAKLAQLMQANSEATWQSLWTYER